MPNNGLLLVDKPLGLTSHDVIAHLRRTMKTRKLGHTGTLDPMATGLLPILVGKATRLSQYLLGSDKSYEAVLKLGISTDTLDATGAITAEKPVSIKEEELRQVISSFVGKIAQKPPMYSAKKVAGKRLYEIARTGAEVERAPCEINIYSIDITNISLPSVTIDVHCSAGTYIRVLASDIGEKLGTGAHLTALRRTKIGPFELSMSQKLAAVEAMGQEAFKECLPMAKVLYSMPQIELNSEQYQRIIHGNFLTDAPNDICRGGENSLLNSKVALLYHKDLVAIGEFLVNDAAVILKPNTVFTDGNE